jgi:hypothetical protein
MRRRRQRQHGRREDSGTAVDSPRDRLDVLIEDMQERQRRLLRLRQPRRSETQQDRRLDRVVQGDREDMRWARK